MYTACNNMTLEGLSCEDFKVLYKAVLNHTKLWPKSKNDWHFYRGDVDSIFFGGSDRCNLPEIKWDPKKCFRVGEVYTVPGLYTPSYEVKVIGRTEDKIFVKELEHWDAGSEVYQVEHDFIDGSEYATAWEYKGLEGCIRSIGEVF